MAHKTILIMAGGTGGHVFPAIAVADELLDKGYKVHWLGTEKGIEARVVPENNLPIHFIRSTGMRGKGVLSGIKAVVLMFQGLWQSLQLIRKLQPVSVLGMGGFVTVPGGLASFLLKKPLVIHEQNAVAGTANRVLSKFAKHCLEGFPKAFSKGELTGNPVRKEIALLEREQQGTNKDGALNLLVIGGSLGAKPINDILPEVLREFVEREELQVWHQTGNLTFQATVAKYEVNEIDIDNQTIKVVPFIENMPAAYQWADFVLCRAGAITLAEIACVGLPAILVPLPHAIDDHQRKNAEFYAKQNAAVLLLQHEMSPEKLKEVLNRFINNRNLLQECAKNSLALAKPFAAQKVASICLEAANG